MVIASIQPEQGLLLDILVMDLVAPLKVVQLEVTVIISEKQVVQVQVQGLAINKTI